MIVIRFQIWFLIKFKLKKNMSLIETLFLILEGTDTINTILSNAKEDD